MKRKITQLGRLFAAAALLWGATSVVSAQNAVKVAYFTDVDNAAYPVIMDNDTVGDYEALFTALKNGGFDVTAINYTDVTFTEEMVASYAANYDVAVLAGAGGSSSTAAASWDAFLDKMPLLTTKAFWFAATSTSGGVKGSNNVSGDDSRYMTATLTGHPIFDGITLDANNTFAVFNALGIKNSGQYLQTNGTLPGGTAQTTVSTINNTSYISVGEAWYDDGIPVVVIPFDAVADTETAGALTTDGATLFVNAVSYLAAGVQYEAPADEENGEGEGEDNNGDETPELGENEVLIDFPFTSPSEEPTITPSDVITYTGYTLSENFSLTSSSTVFQNSEGSNLSEYTYLTLTSNSGNAEAAIKFNFQVPTGYTFTPTHFSCAAVQTNTNAVQMTIYLNTADGGRYAISDNAFYPVRPGTNTSNKIDVTPYLVDTDLSDITVPAGTMSIEVYMDACASGKSAGVCNLELQGTYENGGIRIAYFTDVDGAAYTVTTDEGTVGDYEALYNALSANNNFVVTPINYTNLEFDATSVADYAANYDVALFAGAGGSSKGFSNTWYYFLGEMPVLTCKAFWFGVNDGVKGSNPVTSKTNTETPHDSRYMVPTATDHALFEGITTDGEGKFAMFNEYTTAPTQYLQATGTLPGEKPQTGLSYIYTDADENACIGEAWYNGVGTVVIPFDAVAATELAGQLTDDGAQLFVNAINYLTDGNIGSLSAPVITFTAESEDEDAENYVVYDMTITADEGANIYYTLDGTTPSDVNGTLYTEPVQIINGCYVNAIAVAPKCYDSEVTEYTFVNDRLAPLATPEISYEQGDNYVEITISTTDDLEAGDFAIYYTLDGTDPTEESNVYTEPFRTYKESVVVKAIAIGATYTSSDIAATDEIVNDGYEAMEKTVYYSNFYDTPENEEDEDGNPASWYYAEVTSQLTAEEQAQGIVMDTESTPRPNIFQKNGSESYGYNCYKQYNGWSFYAGTARRILIQKGLDPSNDAASKGAVYMLATAIDGSAAPQEAFEGPFDVEIYAKGGSSASADVYILVGPECEGTDWTVIGKATVSGGTVAEQVTASYTGTDEVYVRVYTASTELYLYDFRIKGFGYDPIELQSVSPAGSTSSATPVTIDADQSEFVLTFNNPIQELSEEGYVYFGTETGTGENNCEISIEDNVVTVTRPDAGTDLEPGLYRLRINGLVDVAGQTLGNTNYFYLVEEAAESEPAEGDIVYIYKSGYNNLTPANDPFLELISDYTVVGYDLIENGGGEGVAPDIDYLSQYKLVILSEAMSGNTTYTNGLVDLVGQVPMISFKDFNYTSGRWSWATPVNPTKGTTYVTPNEAGLAHAIFDGITPDADGNVAIFDTEDSSNNEIQAWQVSTMTDALSALNPTVLATTAGDDDYATIHVCEPTDGSRYVLLPFSSDALSAGTTGITDDAANIFLNAVDWVLAGEDNSGEGGGEGEYSGSFKIDFPFASTTDVPAIYPAEVVSYDGYTMGEGVSLGKTGAFKNSEDVSLSGYTFNQFSPTESPCTLVTLNFTVAEGCTLTPSNFSCAAAKWSTGGGTMTIYLNTSDGGRYALTDEGFSLVRAEKTEADGGDVAPTLIDTEVSSITVPAGAMSIEAYMPTASTDNRRYGICDIVLTGTYTSETETSGVVAPEAAKTAVNVEYFSITGAAQNGLVKGINLVRTTYDDGTVEVSKVLSNE